MFAATQAAQMSRIRQNVPDHFLFNSGIGEQGGDLKATIGSLRNNHEVVADQCIQRY
ncbi:MAG: hypothetical protein U0T81_00300 [Saprospiraceae bacterium]